MVSLLWRPIFSTHFPGMLDSAPIPPAGPQTLYSCLSPEQGNTQCLRKGWRFRPSLAASEKRPDPKRGLRMERPRTRQALGASASCLLHARFSVPSSSSSACTPLPLYLPHPHSNPVTEFPFYSKPHSFLLSPHQNLLEPALLKSVPLRVPMLSP